MAYGVKLKVWGDYGAFNRPEMKVERVSYDVITPSAARGILEAIYWKPEMKWIVDRIHVLKPICFTHVRRNEIDQKIPVAGKSGVATAMRAGKGTLGMDVTDHRQQRAAMILRDVCYGIVAHIEVVSSDNSSSKPHAKHVEMFTRRAKRGQCFHHPYLGTREFPASFELVEEFPECPPELKGRHELGYMLHDVVFQPDAKGNIVDANSGRKLAAEPRFFRATMNDGVIDVPSLETARA